MLKKVLSVVLCVVMVITLLAVPANATSTEKKSAQDYGFGVLKGVVENYDLKYFDEDGNEVDTTVFNREPISTYSRLPQSYNLKDENRITSVKDQGSEGLCWDFAATGSIESSILSKPELLEQLPENAHETLDLSEVGNTWYIHTNYEDEDSILYNEYVKEPSKGAEGAWPAYVAMGLSSGYGTYPEELMPYECWGDYWNESLRFYSDYRLKGFNELSKDNVELIKQSLMEYGAISVSYNCYDSNYNNLDNMVTYYDNGDPIEYMENDLGHAVIITGWDDNFSKENFCEEMRPENDGAWLCRNSWGDEWGAEGYFWMSFETSVNGLGQFEMQSAENVDNIYQNEAISIDTIYNALAAANVFTAQSDEEITQVCFSNIGACDFTVDIYKLNDDYTSPVDGELLTSFNDSVDYEGIHIIDCPQGVYVSKGDVFSVVITDETGLMVKCSSNDISNFRNVSFVMNEDGEYIDAADMYNVKRVAIKAYTKNRDGAVNKEKLSQSIDEAKSIETTEEIPQEAYDELSSQLEKAQELFDNENATQNMVDNQTCLLNSAIETIEGYFFEINSLDDFMYYYNKITEEGFFKSEYIILNTDLDLSSIENFEPLYSQSSFSGVFDGNNHTISGLKMKGNGLDVGLFYQLYGATVKDLTLADCEFISDFSATSITPNAENSNIINCDIKDSTIMSMIDSVGGIVGNTYESTIEDCDLKNVDMMSVSTAGLYTIWDCSFDTCTADDVTFSSLNGINTANNISIESFSEYNNRKAMVKLSGSKCVVENYFGTIVSISVDGAEIKKVDDHYEFEVQADNKYVLDIVYEDIPETEFGYACDFLNDELELITYYGESGELVFPSDISGHPVVEISNEFVNYYDGPITSITFGGIKNIENSMFSSLPDLEKLVFNEGIEYIGVGMFNGCPLLTEITFPDSLVEIGESSFSHCNNLEKVNFGSGLKKISSYAFMGNHKLKGLEFPDSLEILGEYAFEGSGATSAVFGKNIQRIYEDSIGFTGYVGENYTPVRITDFKVYGYAGTYAQTYAEYNGFEFIDITDSKPEIIDEGFDYSKLYKGDVDLDSKVTIFDATLAQMYIAGVKELNDVQKHNAVTYFDLTNDISIMSVTQIQRYVAGIITDFYPQAQG